MCVAVPARVIERRGERAQVKVGDHTRDVSVVAVPDIEAGDYVMLSFGMAVERLTADEVVAIDRLWHEVIAAQDDMLEGSEVT
ncbi:MAG: HypC/HybG/HupF family hydrogenase formation chaperone [Dehalococcoidia bacterium]|nr:HypC/HybG/HupF family hydrogenase formation chaperone [Dehalococcoidia bacterium]